MFVFCCITDFEAVSSSWVLIVWFQSMRQAQVSSKFYVSGCEVFPNRDFRLRALTEELLRFSRLMSKSALGVLDITRLQVKLCLLVRALPEHLKRLVRVLMPVLARSSPSPHPPPPGDPLEFWSFVILLRGQSHRKTCYSEQFGFEVSWHESKVNGRLIRDESS